MPKRKASLYPAPVQELIAAKAAVLSKAQAFADVGMEDMARTLWLSAAEHEERLAPLLEALGLDLEAAVHRISAAGCYRRAGTLTAAVNNYRGAVGAAAGTYAAGSGPATGGVPGGNLPGDVPHLGTGPSGAATDQGMTSGMTSVPASCFGCTRPNI